MQYNYWGSLEERALGWFEQGLQLRFETAQGGQSDYGGGVARATPCHPGSPASG